MIGKIKMPPRAPPEIQLSMPVTKPQTCISFPLDFPNSKSVLTFVLVASPRTRQEDYRKGIAKVMAAQAGLARAGAGQGKQGG